MNSLFENILWEASKRRFIDKVYYDVTANPRRCELFLSHTKSAGKRMPGREALVKWVDSGAADKYKIDWNIILKSTPDNPGEFGRLVDAYYDYETQSHQAKRTNPVLVFKNSGLRYNTDENPDFKLLGETSKFIFIGVYTHEAAIFCDSFNCGGAGAKWCIGMEENTYWDRYNIRSHMFVLAYSKEFFADTDKQKYMLELYIDGQNFKATVWDQPDNDIMYCDSTNGWDSMKAKFEIGEDECKAFFDEVFSVAHPVFADSLSLRDVLRDGKTVAFQSAQNVAISDFDTDDFDYNKLLGKVKGLRSLERLTYFGNHDHLKLNTVIMGPKNVGNYNSLRQLGDYPDICIRGCDAVDIQDLYISAYSRGLVFSDCGKITINTAHLPAYIFLMSYVAENGTKDLAGVLQRNSYNQFGLELKLPNCEIKNVVFNPSTTYCHDTATFAFSTPVDPDRDLPLLIMPSALDTNPIDVSDFKQYIVINFRNSTEAFTDGRCDVSRLIKNVTNKVRVIMSINIPNGYEVYWSDSYLYPDISFETYTLPPVQK